MAKWWDDSRHGSREDRSARGWDDRDRGEDRDERMRDQARKLLDPLDSGRADPGRTDERFREGGSHGRPQGIGGWRQDDASWRGGGWRTPGERGAAGRACTPNCVRSKR